MSNNRGHFTLHVLAISEIPSDKSTMNRLNIHQYSPNVTGKGTSYSCQGFVKPLNYLCEHFIFKQFLSFLIICFHNEKKTQNMLKNDVFLFKLVIFTA